MLLTLDLLEVELNQVNINRYEQLKQYENQKKTGFGLHHYAFISVAIQIDICHI
jgi:hypothetical protein